MFFVLEEREKDRSTALAALEGSGVLVGAALVEVGLRAADGAAGIAVDVATLELARIVYRPNSIVGGVQRAGNLVVLRDQCFSAAELAAEGRVANGPAKKRRRSGRSPARTRTVGGPTAAFRAAGEIERCRVIAPPAPVLAVCAVDGDLRLSSPCDPDP